VQSVKVLAHGFTAEDVERIIGLWPVFTDHKGGMFSDARPVTSARVRELTEEAVASLTAREKEMTAAYLRAFPSALFHEEGYALPVLEVGQHIDMYGEVWRYNGPDDWERVRGVDGSADPDSPNYDSVGTMDDDEMEGQTFTLTEAPA
jgi:hypothetical protein